MRNNLLLFFLVCSTLDASSQINAADSTNNVDSGAIKIYDFVEVIPEYPGGAAAMQNYLAHNLHYPIEAAENGIEGTVYIKFYVDTAGNIRDPYVFRGVSPVLDSVALEVISNMPNWKPGMQSGKKVNVRWTVPIKFVLEDDKKKKKHH